MTVRNSTATRSQLIRYLPEVYQEDGPGREFLERFLGIFESVLFDLEETISTIPGYFDPLTAPEDFIPWLAQWLSLDLYELLGEKNREFILRAFDFYKHKGTVSGIESLVAFLTGIEKCRVKEYTHNVFRSAGLEAREFAGELEAAGGNVSMARTVDTSDRGLLARMNTFYDEVHYVTDASPTGRYAHRVIGLFIFLSAQTREFIIKEGQLHKIIDSFLPVFVRAEINIVEEGCAREVYSVGLIHDGCRSHIRAAAAEETAVLQGIYQDEANWRHFYSYQKGGISIGETNNWLYRIPNMALKKESPV